MAEDKLPFKVGQLVETRSFSLGYRGAWFRCKIKDITQKKGVLTHGLEYYDFPDERLHRTKVYQKSPLRSKEPKRELMVRPCFPPTYRESELPNINTITEVIVVVKDVWRVGDLVDWWTDNCYWSGTLIEDLGNEKFKIKLWPPPVGEGSFYEVSSNDLRPSLDWSPKDGWTVASPIGGENSHACAQIIKPANPTRELEDKKKKPPLNNVASKKAKTTNAVDNGKKEVQERAEPVSESAVLFSSHGASSSLLPLDEPEKTMNETLSAITSKKVRSNKGGMEKKRKQPLNTSASEAKTTHSIDRGRKEKMRKSPLSTKASNEVKTVHSIDESTKEVHERRETVLESNLSSSPLPIIDRSKKLRKPSSTVASKESKTVHAIDEGKKEVHGRAGVLLTSNASHISPSSLLPIDQQERTRKQPSSAIAAKETKSSEISKDKDVTDCGIDKASCSNSVLSLPVGNTLNEAAAAGNIVGNDPLKKVQIDGSISMNSMISNAIEAPILDLEELVNRVKWIKSILQFGMPNSPSWEFVEHRAPSMPK